MVIAFPVSDAEERRAALDVQQSCIVEAPAGSGKTGLLIQRFLKLLATVDQPSEVLALTFTNKATAEMKERVLRALRSAAAPLKHAASPFEELTHALAADALRRDVERGWRLLERPHLLNIRTIDSLCGQIARALPLLSGEAGIAAPVTDAMPLYRRAAHAVMMRFGGDDEVLNHAVETVLLHRDGDLPFCERTLAEMLGTREQWGSLIPLGSELTEHHLQTVTLPRLNGSLDRTICASLEHVREGFDDDAIHEIARITDLLSDGEGYKGAANPFTTCAGLRSAPGCTAADLHHWQAVARLLLTADGWRRAFSGNHVGTAIAKQQKDRLQEILADHGTDELFERLDAVRAFEFTCYPEEQWLLTKALFRLLERALIELQLLFAREEVSDFAGVALAARTALEERGGNLEEVLGTRLQHLLVDEMQDTSASQYRLLELLVNGWDGSSQTVFLVGDPKQSIYLFRQARVDRFQQCMDKGRLGGIALQALRLSTNFRSGPLLVEEANGMFQQMFPPNKPADGDVEFHPATAANEAVTDEGRQWHCWTLPYSTDLAFRRRLRRSAIRREAREAVGIVKEWQAKWTGKAPLKAAVLTRARTHVTELAKAFDAHSIPYRAVDLQVLNEQQEILDIVAITRALSHPADRTAWLALLRAPWCGLELAHLHTVAAGDSEAHAKDALRLRFRERANLLPPDGSARLLRTLDVIDAALLHAAVEPLSVRVDRAWRSLGGDLCTGAVGRANVAQFLRVLALMEAEGEAVTPASLNRRLEKLFAQSASTPGAVDIMTIHRAKGLEWDLVIVPGLHRLAGRDSYPALEWTELPTRAEDGSGDVLLAPLPGKGGEAGALLTFIRERKRSALYFELKRLFYVASTRARTSLHLFAYPAAGKEGKAIHPVNTLLGAAWNAAEENFPPRVDDPMDELVPVSEVPSLSIAASAEAEPVFRLQPLQRLDPAIDPLQRLHTLPSAALPAAMAPPAHFQRPEGSFGARAVGNAIHAFVERLSGEVAQRVSDGQSTDAACSTLRGQLEPWRGAVRNTLRGGGLPPSVIARTADTVLRALDTMLDSTDGRWLLQPHLQSSDESAWRSDVRGEESRVRLDRSFFAGAAPGLPGADHFWIVDFKTADHTSSSRDAFLSREREKYAAQLQTYAEVRTPALPPGTPIMLALFFPLMGALTYWRHGGEPALEPVTLQPAGQISLFD